MIKDTITPDKMQDCINDFKNQLGIYLKIIHQIEGHCKQIKSDIPGFRQELDLYEKKFLKWRQTQWHEWNNLQYCHKCSPSCNYRITAMELSKQYHKTKVETPEPTADISNNHSRQVLQELEDFTGVKQQQDVLDENGSIMNDAYMKRVDSGDYRIQPTKLTVDLEGENSYIHHVRQTVIKWIAGQEILT